MPLRLLVPALIVVLTSLSVSSATPDRALRTAGENHAALDAFHGLPLAFVANAGQLDRRARFSAQAGSGSVFLTRRGVVVALAKGRRGLALRLAFLGASPQATITGADRSPGRVNYLIGNDPARWQTNLPTYAEVLYRELWPGIDLAVRGQGGQLKYEFRLDPGADPARIRLRYRGQERLSLGSSGALRIETALGLLRDARPQSYQPVGGRRVAVASRFALGRGGAYSFAVAGYDRRYPLVIDPGLVYATLLGGSDADYGVAIAVDGAGSAYVTGTTGARNFPTTTGGFDTSYAGLSDVFVTKVMADGSALAYSTFLGGSNDDYGDYGAAIAVDGAGSAYVTGGTSSTDFPTTAGAFNRTHNGGIRDAFVAKLNPAGSALAYSTYLGGSTGDFGSGIAVDGGGAYVTGGTGWDFPTTAGAFDRSYNGGDSDAFVTKLTADGSALAYSTYLGGSGEENRFGIAVDRASSAYVTGGTDSKDFPSTAGAFDRSYNGGYPIDDAFVAKLDATGSALVYSTFLGGSDDDYGAAIAVDGAGSAYVTGRTKSKKFPTTPDAFDRSNDYEDAFATKLTDDGSALAYSTFLGGSDGDYGAAIAVDDAGNAYVTGSTNSPAFFNSTNFPTTRGAFDRSYNRDSDAFVTKLTADGSALAYSTYLGGSNSNLFDDEYGAGIATDGAGSAYVTGATGARNFPTTAGAFDRSYNDGGDAFVTKLDPIAGPVRCWVPRVIEMRLAKAGRAIRAMDCAVGRIRRVRSRREAGRVLGQSPRAGAVRRRGFRVRLVVGRR